MLKNAAVYHHQLLTKLNYLNVLASKIVIFREVKKLHF